MTSDLWWRARNPASSRSQAEGGFVSRRPMKESRASFRPVPNRFGAGQEAANQGTAQRHIV